MVDRLFELETDRLELPYGFLSRVEVATETQTIELARGDHELLQADESVPLSESYCRKTIQQPNGIFHINNAEQEGFVTDPAYRRFELGTYLGGKIEFEDETYGTFCFASSEPREDPITEREQILIDMLSTWASNELHHRRIQNRYKRDMEQIEEMTGIVSHDLRNPLAIAQGQVELLSGSIQESVSKIDKAHKRMDTLIEDILTFTRIDESVENPAPVSLKSCVDDAWEGIQTSDATLTIAFEDTTIRADEPRLKRLFENLFRNAVEHGGESVSIEVGVTENGLYVADDGPGIPASERELVFEAGYSGTTENTGFGLSIVHRVADAHGWKIFITDSTTGGARFEITGVQTE
ncbi:sensor histidine kinase [Halorubrum pallidum]|uniref:histidine kinase n=1 Tax=Halorubrum pallidum TaxID=1526114 RepID=A0ABD5T2V7_9EURY